MRAKVKALVALMKVSKYTVCYTGAGISTSANIPGMRERRGEERKTTGGMEGK